MFSSLPPLVISIAFYVSTLLVPIAHSIMFCVSLSISSSCLQGKDRASHISTALNTELDTQHNSALLPGLGSICDPKKQAHIQASKASIGRDTLSWTMGVGTSTSFQYFKSQKETRWPPAGELLRRTQVSVWAPNYPYLSERRISIL